MDTRQSVDACPPWGPSRAGVPTPQRTRYPHTQQQPYHRPKTSHQIMGHNKSAESSHEPSGIAMRELVRRSATPSPREPPIDDCCDAARLHRPNDSVAQLWVGTARPGRVGLAARQERAPSESAPGRRCIAHTPRESEPRALRRSGDGLRRPLNQAAALDRSGPQRGRNCNERLKRTDIGPSDCCPKPPRSERAYPIRAVRAGRVNNGIQQKQRLRCNELPARGARHKG